MTEAEPPQWITVAAAAALMRVSHRQALRLLVRHDGECGGRLLRKLGSKRMPKGVQSSKYLVSTETLADTLRPEIDPVKRDIDILRDEVQQMGEKIEALRRSVRTLLKASKKEK